MLHKSYMYTNYSDPYDFFQLNQQLHVVVEVSKTNKSKSGRLSICLRAALCAMPRIV